MLATLGQTTAGVWARADALLAVSRIVIARLLAEGQWQRPLPGVYADGGYELSAVQWAFAAVLASGGNTSITSLVDRHPSELGAIACGRTAARVRGIPLIDDDDATTGAAEASQHDVATWSRMRTLRTAHAVVHRHGLTLADLDIYVHESGLWLTSWTRTLFDLTRLTSVEALVCALDHALHVKAVSLEDLSAEAARHVGRRYHRAFCTAVALADGRAESPGETLARLLLLPVLPGLVPQVVLLDGGAKPLARLDLGDEVLKFAVEVDGKRGHSAHVMAAKDQRRDERTERLGWKTVRVTWRELRCEPSTAVRRVLSAADAHRVRHSPER